MPVRLFNLRGVPEDEAEDIRALLKAHDIAFYETPPGNWGVSSPGFWLNDNAQLEEGRRLIAEYQQKRLDEQRELFEQRKRAGEHRGLIHVITDNPLRFVLYLAIAATVIYFSVMPFFHLGR